MNKFALFWLCVFVAYMPFEGMGYFEDLPSGSKLLGGVVVGSAALAFLSGCRIRMLSRPLVVRTVLVVYSAACRFYGLRPLMTRCFTFRGLPKSCSWFC